MFLYLTTVAAKLNVPRFSKNSWVAFPALRGAYKHVQVCTWNPLNMQLCSIIRENQYIFVCVIHSHHPHIWSSISNSVPKRWTASFCWPANETIWLATLWPYLFTRDLSSFGEYIYTFYVSQFHLTYTTVWSLWDPQICMYRRYLF